MGSKVQFWGPISLCLCAFLGLEFWQIFPRNEHRNDSTLGCSPERKPERGYVRMFLRNENRARGYVRQNHPLRNRPFCLPVTFWEAFCYLIFCAKGISARGILVGTWGSPQSLHLKPGHLKMAFFSARCCLDGAFSV